MVGSRHSVFPCCFPEAGAGVELTGWPSLVDERGVARPGDAFRRSAISGRAAGGISVPP
jgi:hypothetical protein